MLMIMYCPLLLACDLRLALALAFWRWRLHACDLLTRDVTRVAQDARRSHNISYSHGV